MKQMRIWLRQGASTLLGGAAVGLFMLAVVGTEDGRFGSLPEMAATFVFVGVAYMQLIMLLVAYKATLPMAGALGATRRSCFWGIQVTKLLPVLAVSALVGLLYGALPHSREQLLGILPFIAPVLLLTASLGALGGLAFCRWGKLGALVLVGVIIVGAMAMGAAYGILYEAGGGVTALLDSSRLPLYAAGAALAVYGINVLLEWRVLKTYEVKL